MVIGLEYEIATKYLDFCSIILNGKRVSIRSELEDKEILRDLATYNDANINESVAKHPNTPVEVLAMLAESEEIDTRIAVATNLSTTAEILHTLAKRSFDRVAKFIAKNPNTAVETLEIFARRSSSSLRAAVASNPNTPIEILLDLINCNSPYISKEQVMYGAVLNPNMPKDVLADLAKSRNIEIRRLVAVNPNTDADTLLSLYRDREKIVQEAVYERIGGSGFDSYVNYWTQES